MGLNSDDPRPTRISFPDAYSAIREWYQANIHLVEPRSDDYARGSAALIRALPSSEDLSTLEFRAVFAEVISGYLEWGYHRSDGRFKMGAYAHAALEAAGVPHSLSEEQRSRLRASRLWPFLFFGRGRTEFGAETVGGPLPASDCPVPDCPLRSAWVAASSPDTTFVLGLMTVGGGRHAKPPKDQFLDLVRRVHKGMRAREVILTDPYVYSDVGEERATGGQENLIDYLRALNLDKDSHFVLKVNPSPRYASAGAKALLERSLTTAFPRGNIGAFSSASRFHDRFYLVRDTGGRLAGVFGPSLNGLGSDSVVLMGELEENTLDRPRALLNRS